MMMDPPYQNQQPPPQVPQKPYMMSQQPQQQQHQPQQQQYSASLQPQPTTSTAQEEEEEEEFCRLWIGDLQHWMDEEEEEEVRTLWIGDLQHWMDEAYIDYCFSHTGEVFTSKVIRNGKSDQCYGFILFKSHAIAERILHRFNGTPMPRVALGTNFSLNWEAKVVTDGTTTWNEILTTGQGQCGCVFSSTIPQIPSSIIGPATNKKTVGGGASQFSRVEMVNNSSWEDMLKWWSLSQLDGTCTAHTVHAAHRVYKIAAFLNISPIRLEDKCRTPTEVEEAEGLLDELQSHVNSINVAKELHSMGALEPLLCNLSCEHAGVGAKAAKVVSTMLQNNPGSQQLVMEAGGEEHLFHTLFCSVDATTVTNVLSAISSLFRNNTPAITAFQQRNGYAGLIRGLNTMWVDSQRNTLNLIHCLVLEDKLGCNIVIGLEYHHSMMNLASSDCALVRVAALKCLLLLTQVEGGGNSGQLVKNDDQLRNLLQERIEEISAMAPEDLGAAREEIQLVDSLWNACYNEPSSLRREVSTFYL